MGDFWVIVTEATSDSPTCYILTPEQVRSMAYRRETNGKVSYWLQLKQ
jgi:hypothetical protein